MSLLGLYWETPWVLLGLLVVPLLLARLFTLGTAGRVPMPTTRSLANLPRGLAARLWWLPGLLRIATVTVLVLVLARPQTEVREVVTGEGVDVMLALDMSGSMNVVDMPEGDLAALLDKGESPNNRFEAARDILKDFIQTRTQDRMGLVIFGPQAWLAYPLTLDYARLVRSLDELILDAGLQLPGGEGCINGCTISGSGTAIGDALGRAFNRLRRSTAKTKLILLITDGKQEAGTMDPLAIARHIKGLPEEERPRIYTFQVGSQTDTWLPRRDLQGRIMTDANSVPMYERPGRAFPVDPLLLRQLAELTGGRFYESYSEEKFREDIADLERTVFKTEVHVARSDVFWPWVVAALLLLLAEWALRLTVMRRLA